MPFPNEHAARLISKETEHIRVGRTSGSGKGTVQGGKVPASIKVIWFIVRSEGKEVPRAQALRFPTSTWTEAAAHAWLRNNKIKTILFEAAGPKNADHIDELHNPPEIRLDDELFADDPTDRIESDIFRYDVGRIPDINFTNEGYIRGSARVTRTGVFLYKNPDGTIRRELRHPDDIFKADSLDTMKMIPITNGHPMDGKVDSTSSRYLKIGNTGETVDRDGQFIKTSIVIMDADGVQAVQAGKNGFSLGYKLDLIPEKGKYLGEQYDHRQTNVRYNHLALVDSPRAGDGARLRMDAFDVDGDEEIKKPDPTLEPVQFIGPKNSFPNIIFNSNPEGGNMPQVNIDGIAYEATQEVINALQKETTENLDLRERCDKAEKDLQKVTGERDELKTKHDELKTRVDNKDDLNKGIRVRIDLEKNAARVLNQDEMNDIEIKSNKEIKVAVIKSKHPDVNLDEKADEYIDARFDSIIEDLGDGNDNNNRSDSAIKNQKKKVVDDPSKSRQDESQEGARKRMIDRQQKAWEPKESK